MNYIELDYVNRISPRLERFRIAHRNPYKINFRCPYCGDSETSKTKARGWLIEKNGKFFYYCHNCFRSENNFGSFLKFVDPFLFREFQSAKFSNIVNPKKESIPIHSKPKFRTKPKDGLIPVSDNIQALNYLKSRQIPEKFYDDIFYVDNFTEWTNKLDPETFPNTTYKESRILFPLRKKDGTIFGYSARSLKPSAKMRYITIRLNDETPKIYGMNRVDMTKTYFVLEGIIDSFFLNNSIAMVGASVQIKELSHPENAIFVFDAEPRNREIHSRMKMIINSGLNICIWGEDVFGKDLNEMKLNGMNNFEEYILEHTYSGLQAELNFNIWKRR